VRVVGVIDLLGGSAVRARGGERRSYMPIEMVAGRAIGAGDAIALADFYVKDLGITDLYVADLDAIARGRGAGETIRTTARRGASIWLDAGISTVSAAAAAFELGVARAIVGLETLTAFEALDDICRAHGQDRILFSLDLRDGQPLLAATNVSVLSACGPSAIAARAVAAGAAGLIVLDLARVGRGVGLDLALVGDLRRSAPDVMLLAGGGVRDVEDLRALAARGCDGALVATALHDGRIGARDIAAARHFTAG
jgi:phosphoribosylformimino-5-aminoimidazole carboxamide ribotide isomerase